jgi:cobalt-zinc-cadmium efflux system protein
MKTERNILIAFLLNLSFSIFEVIGGVFTGSVAIISDAVHDFGDALSIGIAFLLEKKSKRQPDEKHTYGYVRYSLIGGLVTTIILLVGSAVVIYNAVGRIFDPVPINYDGMIVFAVVGAVVNLFAAFFTREGESLNQRAVNLHMLEDVLGWIVVLLGAIVMRFTDISLIDPILSVCVAVFILVNAIRNLTDVIGLFLEKTPKGIDVADLKEHIAKIEGVANVHHVHVWSLDGNRNYATLHIVTDSDPHETKERVRKELEEHGICHATLELESSEEFCHEENCKIDFSTEHSHAHHHHHHH